MPGAAVCMSGPVNKMTGTAGDIETLAENGRRQSLPWLGERTPARVGAARAMVQGRLAGSSLAGACRCWSHGARRDCTTGTGEPCPKSGGCARVWTGGDGAGLAAGMPGAFRRC